MDHDIILQAHKLGVADSWPMWAIAPETLGSELLEVSKRAARFLRKADPSKSHSDCLESVALAAGMPTWHALQTLAQALIDDFHPDAHWPRPEGAYDRAAVLAPAFPMLARATPSSSPTPEQRFGLQTFAERLSAASSLPLATTKMVVAKMNGADSWDDLLARRPESTSEFLSEFLYRFEVEHDDGVAVGRFVRSNACQALVDELDELLEHYQEGDEVEREQVRQRITQVITNRPDFIEGLLVAAELAPGDQPSMRRKGKLLADAIAHADAVIHPTFEGQVSWLHVDNRFYLRLRQAYLEWNILWGSRKRAIDLARRQLQLNPSDNLGARYFLPLLLAADKRFTSARKALAKLDGEDADSIATGHFVRSLVFATLGLRRDAIESLLYALFLFPALRDVIALNSGQWGPIDHEAQRNVLLDRDTLLLQYVVLTPHVAGLEDWFRSTVERQEVRAAEEDLAHTYRRQRDSAARGSEVWRAEARSTSRALAERFEAGA